MANNSQVAHVWAQQCKEHLSGSNFYFDGPTIYSYGSHFPIAKFVERKGKKAVLFTTRGYSNSTSRHISYTRRALHGLDLPAFDVKDPTMRVTSPVVREYFEGLLKSKITHIAQARISTTRLDRIDDAQRIVDRANQMAEWFGFRWRMACPEWGEAYLKGLREKAKEVERKLEVRREADRKARAEQHRQWEERAALQAVEDAKRAEEWVAGADVEYPNRSLYYDPTRLRVRGDIVQTSRGAEIPLPHAKRLWPAIRKVMDSGEPYQHNGHSIHVGEFRIDHIDVDGTLRAGCHTIKYAELERIAKQLGLVEGVAA